MSGSNRIRNIIQELENINSGNINLNYYENYYNYSTNESTSENLDAPVNVQSSIPDNRNESGSNIDQYTRNMSSNTNNVQDENIADITVNLYSPSNLDNTSSSNQGNNSNSNSTPINISANTNRSNIPSTNNISGTNSNIPANILNGISSILGDIGPLNDALSVGASIYRVDNIYNTPATNTQRDYLTLAQLNEKTTVYIQDTANENDKCPICNENYTDNCIYRKNIACGHYFHQGCIDTWYSENYKCPVCNQDIR